MSDVISKVDIRRSMENTGIQNPDILTSLEKSQRQEKENIPDIKEIAGTLKRKLEKMRKIFRGDIQFEIERNINMVVVKIVDREKNEVIRQIPPEVMVKLAKAISEIEGILFDEKA